MFTRGPATAADVATANQQDHFWNYGVTTVADVDANNAVQAVFTLVGKDGVNYTATAILTSGQ